MKRYYLIVLLLPILSAADTVKERPLHWAQPVIHTTIGSCYRVSGDVYHKTLREPDVEDVRKSVLE